MSNTVTMIRYFAGEHNPMHDEHGNLHPTSRCTHNHRTFSGAQNCAAYAPPSPGSMPFPHRVYVERQDGTIRYAEAPVE